MNGSERGNVLFLILIAVALFAALSYAVTNSTRSGGGTERENIKLDIATMMNHIASIQTEILRLSIMEGGTPTLTTDPGGVYEPGSGIPINHPPLSLRDPASSNPENNFAYGLWNGRLQAASVEIGSTNPDLMLVLSGFKEEACRAINRKLLDDETIQSVGLVASTQINISAVYRDGVNEIVTMPIAIPNFPSGDNGCYDLGGINAYLHIIQEN